MIEVHVNFGTAAEAARVARAAVEKRLAACANLHPPIRSFYWWNGAVRDESEAPVVFKTSEARLDALTAFIAAAHSYDTPGIIVHRPAGADPRYLDWIERETAGAESL
jgi:periplasmic divalent cation tolerance protein